MPKVLSISSSLRTGLYKTSTSLFFTPSKLFEAQMTEIFDEVWPTVTALKMLRWQVKGYYEEYCVDNNSRLSAKFVEQEDKSNRPNLYRTCIEETWEDMEYRIAKNLLTNIFACYEAWADNILRLLSVVDPERNAKYLQFPSTSTQNGFQRLLTPLNAAGNADLIAAYYSVYKNSNKLYNYSHLDNWLLYYRYFKECRNAIIHNGGQTTQRMINAYSDIANLTESDLDVLELPQTFNTGLHSPVQLTLRGVVGFSQLTLKIVSTLDIELIKAKNADKYVASRILEEVKGLVTTSSNTKKRLAQVVSLSKKGRFQTPVDVEAAYRVLKQNRVMM